MGILYIGNAILKPHEEIRLASVVDLARHKLIKMELSAQQPPDFSTSCAKKRFLKDKYLPQNKT